MTPPADHHHPRILPGTGASIRRAAEALRAGGLVAFPTETVYGLGANALDPAAVARIFEAKGRPHFDPLIVHVPDIAAARCLVASFPTDAVKLAERFWPGPLTLVLPRQPHVPDLVTAGLETVAVRVPHHPLALRLLEAAGCPVAAPSANRFGMISPTTAAHVAEGLGDAVDLILDGGPCGTGVESTVISLVGGVPMMLRPGGLPLEELEAVVGPIGRISADQHAESLAPQAPGMLKRHYAPRTRLVLLNPGAPLPAEAGAPNARVGLLVLGELPSAAAALTGAQVEQLSVNGDLAEAARNLFAAMRRLDAAGLDLIVAYPAPEHGLGVAINDRLTRAAS